MKQEKRTTIGYDADGNKIHIEDTRYICTCKECLTLPDELSERLERWENETRARVTKENEQ